MRTITLELLRHGPAHNQLLSPLTPYLALCENHGAVTIHVPFEHNQFLHRLSALGYKFGEESRVFQLNDTARVLGEILGAIPGLTAESGKTNNANENLTHLRLIISASELALLPFELALSPNGLPGSGQHLLLQPQMPICLTREIRRVPGEKLQWPQVPRILFIAASPPEVGEIPVESHLLVLRRQIEPWVKYFHKDDAEMARQRVDEHLFFLPGASIEEIEKQCATNTFTHIHILAHGVERRENYDTRFFLALHSAHDPYKTEYISGARLATALRPSQRPDSGELAKPVVVTLASCDSGSVGSVAGAGASIAHALHESGIPMVVAAQFPLSFEGSVCLVDCLYEGLLWGTDPRKLLYDLRRRLYAQFQDKHDWAGLTAYVSFPPDFEKQLSDLQIEQALRSINAAMNHADEAIRQFVTTMRVMLATTDTSLPQTELPQTENPEIKQLLVSARGKINKAKSKLNRLLDRLPGEQIRILGLQASTDKRQAEILFSTTHSSLIGAKDREQDRKQSLELLRSARDHYWQTFVLQRFDSWALVQYISLSVILNKLRPEYAAAPVLENLTLEKEQEAEIKKLRQLWSMAKLLSEYDLRSAELKRQIWAHSNLAELYLLNIILIPKEPEKDYWDNLHDAQTQALKFTDDFIEIAGRNSFAVYSTRRQMLRYTEWFNKISDLDPLPNLMGPVISKFPEEVEETWK
ncbi:CHAT domain-containing protein [Adhaeribacter rhizoryzae]|uniref:CHAT domain-containing protein n=1 Tax=Adhaeribacter rhizoryzae TaxID=2607907 RepID=A0A5M6DFC5_9BACT|nr:CHAT domain-containing protein [Adhaeribacter rhizoryzae]KAA5544879.1 CHAT domain-containing protein [Adhaeribacter rhizoryzae]